MNLCLMGHTVRLYHRKWVGSVGKIKGKLKGFRSLQFTRMSRNGVKTGNQKFFSQVEALWPILEPRQNEYGRA